MFGGNYYQSFGAFLPAPNTTFLYDGVFPNKANVLPKPLYSDPTTQNARILTFNCVDAGNPEFGIHVGGYNEVNQFVTEVVEIEDLNTPVKTVNKYNKITELGETGEYQNPYMEVGFAEGQSMLLATNGANTTHFVKIDTDSGATWTVWGFIPTTIVDSAQVTNLKAQTNDDLFNKNATTEKPVRVDKSFGYIWIETAEGQTEDVTWVVGSKNLVI